MQSPFNNIVQHLFHQPSLQSVTVDELERMAQEHPYFAAAHFLLLKKMQDTAHPQFNSQLHKTTLYFNNPLWLQFLLQPETVANFTVLEKTPFIENETVMQPVEAKLTLNDLSGVAQDLSKYKGQIVVVNFWATWCVPCKEEMPDLSAIQNDYAALGVQVIGATADDVKDKAKVLKFVREMKVNFPVWMSVKNSDMESFGVGKVLPGTVIVNREGKIVWRKVGKIDAKELRIELDKLLDEKIAHSKMIERDKKKDISSLVPA